MLDPFDEWAKLGQDEARARVVINFDKLIHDLHCLCEGASPRRANAALAACDWTTTEAYEAWYDAFLMGVIGA